MRWVKMSGVLVIALVGSACSNATASDDATTSDDTAPTEEQVRTAAQAQLDNPGSAYLSVASSRAPVASWTLYMGSGVSIVGTDSSGQNLATIILKASKESNAVACVLPSDSPVSCDAVKKAMQEDFAAAGGLGTISARSVGALRPLDTSGGQCAECSKTTAMSLERHNVPWGVPVSISCAKGSGTCYLKLASGDNSLFEGGGYGPSAVQRACCEAHSCAISPWAANPPSGQSLIENAQVSLICRD